VVSTLARIPKKRFVKGMERPGPKKGDLISLHKRVGGEGAQTKGGGGGEVMGLIRSEFETGVKSLHAGD